MEKYVIVTNDMIKSQYKRLKTIRLRLKSNKAKLNRLQNSIRKDERIVRRFEYCHSIEVHKKQYLDVHEYQTIYGTDCRIEALAEDNRRHAEIYQNAHNGETWGCHLKSFGHIYKKSEYYLGNQWEDYDELVGISKEFVATGWLPKDYI